MAEPVKRAASAEALHTAGSKSGGPVAPCASQPTFLTLGQVEGEKNTEGDKIAEMKQQILRQREMQKQRLKEINEKKRKADAVAEKIKRDMIDKINFKGFDQSYYKDLPMQPGVSFFKWLVPKDIKNSLQVKRMPGINALKIKLPETVVYSQRFGVPEVWVGTAHSDGCVVKRKLAKNWRKKFVKKATSGAIWGINRRPSSPRRRKREGANPDVVGMLKIANTVHPQSSATRTVTAYHIEKTLGKPTPEAALCGVQGYVRCKGPRAVVYRVVWRQKKNPYAFCIVNAMDFATVGSKKNHESTLTDDALEKLLTRIYCATSDVNGRGKLPNLKVFEITGQALGPMIDELSKIVKYVQKQDTEYGRMKFSEFVGDFIRSKDGDLVFLQCKAYKLEPECYAKVRKQLKSEEDGTLYGDFASMEHDASPERRVGPDVHLKPPKKKSKFEERLKANGKQCFFCEQKYLEGDRLPLARVGGSPKKRQITHHRHRHRHRHGLDDENSEDGPNPVTLFQRKVENFGYDLTERMMQDTLRTLHRRGINPHCFADHIKQSAARAEIPNPVLDRHGPRVKVGAASDLHKVCRPCFEIHNSQRVLGALSRQFSLSLGVPRKMSKSFYLQSDKVDSRFNRLAGPGRKLKQREDAGGTIAPPAYPSYADPAGLPRPPPNSIDPRFLEWVEVKDAPGHAMQFRMFFFFHELEEVTASKLPASIHAEAQYSVVESVHRIQIPLKERGKHGLAPDVVPIKQLRMNYLYASPKDLQSYLYNTALELKLILTVGEGKDMMAAEGVAKIYLTSFLSSGVGRFGNRGYSHKADMRIVVPTEPLGEVTFRISVGIVGDAVALDDGLLDTRKVRLGKMNVKHNDTIYWMPENYHDSRAMPETWMGAITHGVSALRETNLNVEKEMSQEEIMASKVENREKHIISLFFHLLYANKSDSRAEDVRKSEEILRSVEAILDLRSRSSISSSRSLFKAVAKLTNEISFERNMEEKEAEQRAYSLRRDSAKVALEHAHAEMTFREELKKCYDASRESEARDTRPRRSIKNSKKHAVISVALSQLISMVEFVCSTGKYYRTGAAPALVNDADNDTYSASNANSQAGAEDDDEDELFDKTYGRTVCEVQLQKWARLNHMLEEVEATGTNLITWDKMMGMWNSRKREVEQDMYEENMALANEPLPEAGPEKGGDYRYSEHSTFRRWLRLRAAMLIFDQVFHADLTGNALSKNDHPLQYTTVDAIYSVSTEAVVDIGELHSHVHEIANGGGSFVGAQDVRAILFGATEKHPTHFGHVSSNKLEEAYRNVADLVETVNAVSRALCVTLQEGPLTQHLYSVYSDVASGNILWSEFFWLCEKCVKDSVLHVRQTAAGTDCPTENTFSTDRLAGTSAGVFATDSCSREMEHFFCNGGQEAAYERNLPILQGPPPTVASPQPKLADQVDSESSVSSTSNGDGSLGSDSVESVELCKGSYPANEPNKETEGDAATDLLVLSATENSTKGFSSDEATSVPESPSETGTRHSGGTAAPLHEPVARNAFEAKYDERPHVDSDQSSPEGPFSHFKELGYNEMEASGQANIVHEYMRDSGVPMGEEPPVMEVTMKKRKHVRPTDNPLHAVERGIVMRPKSTAFRRKAKQRARKRLNALENESAGRNKVMEERQEMLKRELRKCDRRAERQSASVENQLDEMRKALYNQLKQQKNKKGARVYPSYKPVNPGKTKRPKSARNVKQRGPQPKKSASSKRPKSAPSRRKRAPKAPSLSSTTGGMVVVSSRRKLAPRNNVDHAPTRVKGIIDEEGLRELSNDARVAEPMLKSALIKYGLNGDMRAVQTLLQDGVDADTNMSEAPHRTLLQEAARTGRVNLVALLLSYGASVIKKDDDGCNALYWAYANGHDRVVDILLEAQAVA